MSTHPIQWQAPEPLWGRFGATSDVAVTAPDQFRPAILRFATDDFMEQIISTLTRDPAHIGNMLARPETWRTPPVTNEKDMMERVAMPKIVQALARRFTLKRSKSPVQAVESTSPVEEKKQKRSLSLKLYQPAHQRFYLVSASLICRVAGLPERAVIQGGSEQIGFVLRRLLPAKVDSKGETDLTEFAFVKDDQGARWQQVFADEGGAAELATGEELLPLFPLNYRDAADHPRTLWTGLIPVGRREEYMGTAINRSTPLSLTEAQQQSLQPSKTSSTPDSITARMTEFKMEVAEPWKTLIRAAYEAQASLKELSPLGSDFKSNQARAGTLNMQWQMQSWLILLDFSDYLATYLPDVWAAIEKEVGINALKPQSLALYNWLGEANMTQALINAMPVLTPVKLPAASLREALKAVWEPSVRAGLEGAEKLYGVINASDAEWPNFHFLLAGLDTNMQASGAFKALATLAIPSPDEINNEVPEDPKVEMDNNIAEGAVEAEKLDRLTALVARALERKPETDVPEPPFALQLSKALKDTQGDAGWFVIRYVHRTQNCGPLHPSTLSEPTQRFQLASFFDYDAPARPIRITLPMDTTPAGLRKYRKNTAFVISDVLCGQIQRAKGLGLGDLVRSVLPWPFHKDLNVGDGGVCSNNAGSIGMICSLSIPIITICALILLIIIVSLLDFIFRWIPYFIMCFPVPGLKGKRGGSG